MEVVVRLNWGRVGAASLEWTLRVAFALGTMGVAIFLWRIARGDGDYLLEIRLSADAVPYVRAQGTQTVGQVSINLDPRGDLMVQNAGLAGRSLLELSDLLGALVTAVVAWSLIRVVETLRAGDPFIPANARRILTIALLMIAAGLAQGPVEGLAIWSQVRGTPAQRLVDIDYGISFQLVAVGLLVLALSEVFRRGARMRAEVEGLV